MLRRGLADQHAEVVDELNVLLTGGRLSPEASDAIADAYDAAELVNGDELRSVKSI